jgi:NTP pyrophosphatase (non-canonical NTP hydrolase)
MISDFETYRTLARRTRASGENRTFFDRIKHWTIGLTGEAGEVANVVKKHACTGKHGVTETADRVLDEAGDVLWYLDALLDEYNISLAVVAEYNINKLAARHNVAKTEFCLPAGTAAAA